MRGESSTLMASKSGLAGRAGVGEALALHNAEPDALSAHETGGNMECLLRVGARIFDSSVCRDQATMLLLYGLIPEHLPDRIGPAKICVLSASHIWEIAVILFFSSSRLSLFQQQLLIPARRLLLERFVPG